jgi:hypothetical protein
VREILVALALALAGLADPDARGRLRVIPWAIAGGLGFVKVHAII